MAVSIALVVSGALGLTMFAFCVWPPLALLPFSLTALVAGILVDWEAVHGKPSAAPDRSG